jgi:hypothetical protein
MKDLPITTLFTHCLYKTTYKYEGVRGQLQGTISRNSLLCFGYQFK